MARNSPWRRDPNNPFHHLQNELGRLVEAYFDPARIAESPAAPTDLEPAAWSPALDVFETLDATVIVMEVPGVDSTQIDLSITGSLLTLRGSKEEFAPPDSHVQRRERRFGPFYRQIQLADDVDLDGIEAEVRNGVLNVRLPKKAAAQPRTIPIQVS
jgi:HSP20 family protein